jgi:arabinogalactan oligomer/maltooligosaccharide transport system substrate-binding protein
MKKLMPFISLLLVAAFVLSACAQATTPAPTMAPQPTTAAPAATDTAVPTTAPNMPTNTPAPTAPPAATPAPVTITIWHQWDGTYLDAITAVFKDYMTQHPNVTITLSKPSDVTSALKVAIPAGQGPDIIGWANDQIGTNALNGNIINLADLGVTDAWLRQTYEPAAVAGVEWNNMIWALPESQEGIALIYNKAVLADNSPYMPKGGTDFADLLAKAKAYATDNKGKYLFCNQAFSGDPYHAAPIYFGFGLPAYVDEKGKDYVNTDPAVQASQWILDVKPYLAKDQSSNKCLADFEAGTAAMMWTGPWNIAEFDKQKINYGFVAMGKPFVGIKTLMITNNAVDRKTAALALDIITFYTNADNQKKEALANKTIPANTAALKSADVQALTTIAGFGNALNVGIPMGNSPFAGAQWTPMTDAINALWAGKQKPADAMAAAAAAIDKAVAAMK